MLDSIPVVFPSQNVVFLDDNVFQRVPLTRGERYYKGSFKAFCPLSNKTFTFFAVDHGAYPWGRSSKKGALAFLCQSLDIGTNSGVFNCCLFTHFLVSILEIGLFSAEELLHNHKALLRQFLSSNVLRNDDLINFALKNLNLTGKVCIRFITKYSGKFCISFQVFGSVSGTPIFICNINRHFFIAKIDDLSFPSISSVNI